ncbi:MAG TPA: helix-turn-helix transcriptional regulator [Kiloniellaceae bacterium]
MSDEVFAENLRLLCSYYESVSAVCRRLGMNRQQFNKYLAGHSMPSRHNLRRICAFFGVEEAEIMLPNRRFAEIVELRPRGRRDGSEQPIDLQHIELLRRLSGNKLDAYLGYYYRYFYSYGFPGRIVKSLLGLYRKDGIYYTKNVGILSDRSEERPYSIHFKYLGLPLLLNDRIFLLEYEQVLQDMVSETILYPAYRNRLDRLLGLQCTLAGRRTREPAAGKVVLEFLGRRINVRKALRTCGLFTPEEKRVPASIVRQLDNHIRPEEFVLLVSEEGL